MSDGLYAITNQQTLSLRFVDWVSELKEPQKEKSAEEIIAETLKELKGG